MSKSDAAQASFMAQHIRFTHSESDRAQDEQIGYGRGTIDVSVTECVRICTQICDRIDPACIANWANPDAEFANWADPVIWSPKSASRRTDLPSS